MEPEEEYDVDVVDDIPLQHKKPFGSGLSRKPIAFVPASSGKLNTSEPLRAQPNKSVGDLYLSLVLPKPSEAAATGAKPGQEAVAVREVCAICQMPITADPGDLADAAAGVNVSKPRHQNHHESSLVHQVCLTHSHPPSALDRSRMGLTYLESYGWDPDSRQGLGAAGQGIQFPLKTQAKNDTLGLGVVIPKGFKVVKKKEKPQLMDAKKARSKAREARKKSERLREQFYGNVDLEKYLGSGGDG